MSCHLHNTLNSNLGTAYDELSHPGAQRIDMATWPDSNTH